MKKVLLMPSHTANGNGGGIRVYNENLVELFENDRKYNVSIFPSLSRESFFGHKYNFRLLKEKIEDIAPDIVHVNGYTNLILKQIVNISRKSNIKVVYTAHWHPFYTMSKSFFKLKYFDFFVKPYLQFVDRIITINSEEYYFFKQYHDNVVLIPHWLNHSVQMDKNKNKIPNRVLFVGTPLWGNKGFEHLMALPINKYDIHCVCREGANLREDMTLHRNISSDELVNLYKSSALLVVPSRYEAFSYVSLEALSLGTPVLMSDRVRIADNLKGISGYDTFEYGNFKDFLEKIDSTMSLKVNSAQISEVFSREKAKESYIQVYSHCC